MATGLLPRVNLVPRVSHLLAQAREERPWFSSLAWAGRRETLVLLSRLGGKMRDPGNEVDQE